MAEPIFYDQRLTDNPFQDPMGDDAHSGLERFIDKFHQPTVPSHTIITDPDYYVFLWFHDANGNLIKCPYVDDETYLPLLEDPKKPSIKLSSVNKAFSYKNGGIQGGGEKAELAENCLDLTPFVREATLPDIQPANAEKIQTLFGDTTAGSFSPYASDGSKPITMQILDTEFSILDAIFYQWMKDINSPWWYRRNKAFSEWATPYPMATLEVQRPRMRYRDNPQKGNSRKDAEYIYYSYKFIGAKPTNYAPFEVNGAGRGNLLRSLSMICDMCFVDLLGDVVGSAKSSVNIGNRSGLLFDQSPTASDSSSNPETKTGQQSQNQNELARNKTSLGTVTNQSNSNNLNIRQQQNGDMPGKDEKEWDKGSGDYNQNEYADKYAANELSTVSMQGQSEDSMREGFQGSGDKATYGDNAAPWESQGYGFNYGPPWENLGTGTDTGSGTLNDQFYGMGQDPNWDFNNYQMDNDYEGISNQSYWDAGNTSNIPSAEEQEEKSFFNGVMDTLKDVGSSVYSGAKTAGGWIADGADAGMGYLKEMSNYSVGAAVDINDKMQAPATNSSTGTLEMLTQVTRDATGAASSLAATTIGAASNLVKGGIDTTTQFIGTATGLSGQQTAAGTQSTVSTGSSTGQDASLFGNLFGSSTKSSQTNSNQSSSGPMGELFSGIGKTLDSAKSLGTTAFGVVSNTVSSAVTGTKEAITGVKNQQTTPVSSTTSTLAGCIGNDLSTAFSMAGDMVGRAGNVVGGVMSNTQKTGIASSGQKGVGAVNQTTSAIGEVRRTGIVASSLNTASAGIVDTVKMVGTVSDSVIKAGTGAASSAVGDFGKLVNRITTGVGNKPSPIENYVDFVAKDNGDSNCVMEVD